MSKRHIVNGRLDMQAAAQQIGIKGGRNGLFKLLRDKGYFKTGNIPTRQLVISGLFYVEAKSTVMRNNIRREYIKVWVTGEGLTWLADFVAEHGELKPQKNTAA